MGARNKASEGPEDTARDTSVNHGEPTVIVRVQRGNTQKDSDTVQWT